MINNIRNRDIVIVGLQAWDTAIGSNCKNIAIEFAKDNRVLYVNYPIDRITLLHEKNTPPIQKRLAIKRGESDNLVKIQNNLWNLSPTRMLESINWIASGFVFDILNKINNKRFAKDIIQGIKKLGFKDFILFNDNDIFRCYYLKELLKPALSIYYIRDFLLGVDYWKRHGARLEPKLIKKADLVVANSTYLADYGKQYNKKSYYVGQGCDVSLFDETLIKDIPSDIKDVNKPIIGYVGALFSLRLDITLLESIAEKRRDWNLVLVGPEDEKFKNSKLHKMDNVSFLGNKDISLLPAYIKHFDVCLNPQTINEVTIGNYPRKIDEYLAMGKAIVATKTKAMEIFSEFTYQAENVAGYIEMIETGMKESTAEKANLRRKFALTHTWENNVMEIYKHINEYAQ